MDLIKMIKKKYKYYWGKYEITKQEYNDYVGSIELIYKRKGEKHAYKRVGKVISG